jgi:tetratricopeptide (TPR) repeat protein
MRNVARKYGLVVNRSRDDRTNIDKSAKAAAKLLNVACIPYIKKYLEELNLPYTETDLWFRLLVLHAYHAGAGNVDCALTKIQPKSGGVELFKQLWQTECGTFKNESQNYSQIALASLLNFDELIQRDGDTIFLVQGDKLFKKYKRASFRPLDAYNYLNTCLSAYESDLVDGTIPYDAFMKRVSKIRKEFKLVAAHLNGNAKDVLINTYPASEEQLLSLANRLAKKQHFDEAISIIKLNIEARPNSVNSYDLMVKVYSQSGNKQLAEVYSNRSTALKEKENSGNKD